MENLPANRKQDSQFDPREQWFAAHHAKMPDPQAHSALNRIVQERQAKNAK